MMPARLQGLDNAAAFRVVAAAQALDTGRAGQAALELAPTLAAYPRHPEVLRLHAGILNLQGDGPGALTCMQQAIALRPTDSLYFNTLATILTDAGKLDEAVAALRTAISLQEDSALAWYNLGIVQIRLVRYTEALAALQRAITLAPDHTQARAQLADILRVANRPDDAVAEYRRVLGSAPWTGMAWWGLANIKTARLQRRDIADMQTALADPRATVDDRVAIGFALAWALDAIDEFAAALDALRRANDRATTIMRERNRLWDRLAFRNAVELLSATDPGTPYPNHDLGREVIFVVGLPRSGTTLVEQILASHSMVEGAGELPDLPLTISDELQHYGGSLAHWLRDTTAQHRQRLGEKYLQRTARWREHKSVFVDKLPGNWMYMGAIRAILPAARIICCRRDPLETCFSCYRHMFQGNEYTRSFVDLADYWRAYDRSVRRWCATEPAHVYAHVYEDLILDPQQSITSLLQFCGLGFEEATLSFHHNQRAVRSPSAMQVRQPLRTDTARSFRYGALLNPLRDALGLPATAPP